MARPDGFESLNEWIEQTLENIETLFSSDSSEGVPESLRKSHRPRLISDAVTFTGYYEPEFEAGTSQTQRLSAPVLAEPKDLDGTPPSRSEINSGVLSDLSLEIAWMDPIDLYFLQVQGSGRLKFPNEDILRIGFAAKSGHDYTSIGKLLIDRGEIAEKDISTASIRSWIKSNGSRGLDLLDENDSYVFFKPLPDLSPTDGPIGTLGKPLTKMRSLAIDPSIVALGSLVWIETAAPIGCRLMRAEDTGSAIKGTDRADIFCGTGDAAGEIAGGLIESGRLFVLEPVF